MCKRQKIKLENEYLKNSLELMQNIKLSMLEIIAITSRQLEIKKINSAQKVFYMVGINYLVY